MLKQAQFGTYVVASHLNDPEGATLAGRMADGKQAMFECRRAVAASPCEKLNDAAYAECVNKLSVCRAVFSICTELGP